MAKLVGNPNVSFLAELDRINPDGTTPASPAEMNTRLQRLLDNDAALNKLNQYLDDLDRGVLHFLSHAVSQDISIPSGGEVLLFKTFIRMRGGGIFRVKRGSSVFSGANNRRWVIKTTSPPSQNPVEVLFGTSGILGINASIDLVDLREQPKTYFWASLFEVYIRNVGDTATTLPRGSAFYFILGTEPS